jgi:hypothetical protein
MAKKVSEAPPSVLPPLPSACTHKQTHPNHTTHQPTNYLPNQSINTHLEGALSEVEGAGRAEPAPTRNLQVADQEAVLSFFVRGVCVCVCMCVC